MAAKRQKGATKDEVTYFYLMKHTEKGTVQSFAQKKKAITAVTKVVRKEGPPMSSLLDQGGAL